MGGHTWAVLQGSLGSSGLLGLPRWQKRVALLLSVRAAALVGEVSFIS